MKTPRWPSPRARGFTLVELLVVVVIVLLVSAVTLPTVLPALSQRQVNESARILQAALVGIRDAAIRANEPRGLRLLLDPVLTQPPLVSIQAMGVGTSNAQAGSLMLAYNRFVPIEPAGDYTEGHVSLSGKSGLHPIPPTLSPISAVWNTISGFPPVYPWNNPPTPGSAPNPAIAYPCYQGAAGRVLMVEEELFVGGPPKPNDTNPVLLPNSPTSWFWNIRVGDKIRIGDSGRYYTVVGPMNITPTRSDPQTDSTGLLRNPEMFVNVGPPGTPSPLARTWQYANGTTSQNPEFLFVVNGQDDNQDGYVDNGWNGIDEDFIGGPDNIEEWLPPPTNTVWPGEAEVFVGATHGVIDQSYTIARRPVPTQGAREVALPPGVVIDATSWNNTQERSRLPIDPNTLYVEVMMNPSGQVIPTTAYSTPVIPGLSGLQTSFFHFWLAERQDVHEMGELTVAPGQIYHLPMPAGTPNYTQTIALKGERRLVTLFTKNGLLTSDTIENFNVTDINRPFQDAQLGMRETK
jgi:prepilin-type N-terminal cleavage/methylation domain-containing protein